MQLQINEIEARVLGSLIEKEMATPEYYPLSLNALTQACNQKSNRDPVMALSDEDVVRALDHLRTSGLAMQSAESARVPKYRHTLAEKLHLEPRELALLGLLLLRGAQTLGELRSRSERLYSFADLESIEETLGEMMSRTPPLVVHLQRRSGHKERRYAHLLAGEPPATDLGAQTAPPEEARLKVLAEDQRISNLEAEVSTLRTEVEELRSIVDQLKTLLD
ncbi:MAG: YceH family protein [Geoalkalibacter sp.]|jgi:uncharacterized protein YceH (UPF0502 family)|uniref:YceH family protein n=1 Tax=Geoalkalibacter sp. TaxID=3041440 RepID=UPI002A9E20D7|nr:YceH family protein [Thermodesulfobacteriota bacterium]